jgi:hypothetical protein
MQETDHKCIGITLKWLDFLKELHETQQPTFNF